MIFYFLIEYIYTFWERRIEDYSKAHGLDNWKDGVDISWDKFTGKYQELSF